MPRTGNKEAMTRLRTNHDNSPAHRRVGLVRTIVQILRKLPAGMRLCEGWLVLIYHTYSHG
jgi:hypothetical protein